MSTESLETKSIERVILTDGRYPLEAYDFLREGLRFTAESAHGPIVEDRSHHVNAQTLCFGLRQFALDQFGALAGKVLSSWNISTTNDFGQMVFLLIRVGEFGKQDSDHIDDFDDVFDFDSAFAEYEVPVDTLHVSLDPED